MASSRVHQLRNGLYVSGAPDKHKDKPPSMTSSAMPYTGGDIKKSGELGKMFDIAVEEPRLKKSGPIHGGTQSSGSFRAAVSTSGPLSSHGYPTIRSSIPNSGPQTSMAGRSRQAAHSGPLFRDPANAKNPLPFSLRTSGSLSSSAVPPGLVRNNSGPLAPNLPATGLITSGPVTSAAISSSKKHSGPLDGGVLPSKLHDSVKNNAINSLSNSKSYAFKRNFPRVILWTVVPLFLIGFVAGGFILVAVQNVVLLIVVICLLCAILVLLAWNAFIGEGAVTGFIDKYSDMDLSQAKDGHYVKVTGVVTCGSVPLETSYQKLSRCVYTYAGLYEYRDFKSKPAGSKHHCFTWGLRHLEASDCVQNIGCAERCCSNSCSLYALHWLYASTNIDESNGLIYSFFLHTNQRHAVDFFISDSRSGLRALVKAGYNAMVTPYVEEHIVVDVPKASREIPAQFLRWLADRNLSSDDRVMRLTEGYIKEGFIVTVMGVVQRNENILMIVPPSEPVSTGCQWNRLLLPATLEGLLLRLENDSKADIVPV